MLTELEKIAPPTRRVLFAIEVIDSVSGATLCDRIKVEPLDTSGRVINGRPLLNQSGKFVWIEPNNAWPAKVRVRPDDKPNPPPFEEASIDTPLPPDRSIPAKERLFTVVLRPADGRLSVRRGKCRGSRHALGGNGRQCPGGRRALVQFAWSLDEKPSNPELPATWHPELPAKFREPTPGEALTDRNGQFAVFVRLMASESGAVGPDGLLKVRLQMIRNDVQPANWIVPAAAWGKDPVDKIPVGRLFDRDVTLRWPGELKRRGEM